MARIKITDLPKDMKISAEEMKRVRGGGIIGYTSPLLASYKDLAAGKIDTAYKMDTEVKLDTELKIDSTIKI